LSPQRQLIVLFREALDLNKFHYFLENCHYINVTLSHVRGETSEERLNSKRYRPNFNESDGSYGWRKALFAAKELKERKK
jgi:hypothetical protein